MHQPCLADNSRVNFLQVNTCCRQACALVLAMLVHTNLQILLHLQDLSPHLFSLTVLTYKNVRDFVRLRTIPGISHAEPYAFIPWTLIYFLVLTTLLVNLATRFYSIQLETLPSKRHDLLSQPVLSRTATILWPISWHTVSLLQTPSPLVLLISKFYNSPLSKMLSSHRTQCSLSSISHHFCSAHSSLINSNRFVVSP